MRPVWTLLALAWACAASAADYEIQVYPSRTAPAGETFIELHGNFTPAGPRRDESGLQPADRAFHETLEVTRGFTDWFETGFYVFSSARGGRGWDWAGDHVRPRVAVPRSWGWPVGVSLSAEGGYWRRGYNEAAWDLEIRPILDWKEGPFYLSVNPAFERTLSPREDTSMRFQFAPNVKAAWTFSRALDAGLEWYANFGPVDAPSRPAEQTHALLAAFDVNLWPEWELNVAGGPGLSPAADGGVIKVIVGRRFASRTR